MIRDLYHTYSTLYMAVYSIPRSVVLQVFYRDHISLLIESHSGLKISPFGNIKAALHFVTMDSILKPRSSECLSSYLSTMKFDL